MGFLNLGSKKVQQGLSKLTEKDIQEKLYGDVYKRSKEDVVTDASAFDTEAPIMNAPRSVPPKPSPAALRSQADALFMDTALTEPSTEEPKFKKYSAPTESFRGVDKPFVETVRPEPKPFRQVIVKKADFKPKPKPQLTLPKLPWNKLKTLFQTFFRAAGEVLSGLGAWIFQGVRQLVGLIYVHRAGVKRATAWVLGLTIVFVLFSSVHYLNIKREKAIKEVKHTKVARSVAIAPVKAQPEKAVSENKATQATEQIEQAETTSGSEISPEKTVPAVTTSVKQSTGRYVIQIATYVVEADAKRMADVFNQQGWPSFVKGTSRAGGRIFYSVYIGRFKTQDDAQAHYTKFKSAEVAAPFQDAFIRTLKD